MVKSNLEVALSIAQTACPSSSLEFEGLDDEFVMEEFKEVKLDVEFEDKMSLLFC